MAGFIWSWEYSAKARKNYDCDYCGLVIEKGMRYTREVICSGRRMIVLRKHAECPPDEDHREHIEKEEHKNDPEDPAEEEIPQAA